MRWDKFNKSWFCFSFLCVSFWHQINAFTNHPLRRMDHIAEQLRYTTLKNGMCCRHVYGGSVWFGLDVTADYQMLICPLHLFDCGGCFADRLNTQLQPDVLVVPRRRATRRRGWLRNRANSNADCSVYAALQLGAGGCPRCMCGRVRSGGVFGREQAITTSISHPDSLRDGKWLLVGFGRWLWMKKVQSYNGFLTNLIHQLNYWSYRPYRPHPSSIFIKRRL